MRILRNFAKKSNPIIILVLILIVLYFEWYTYVTNSQQWHELKCRNEQICTKIILVADPQLIGKLNELQFVTPFSIWDIDRYLFKTYTQVFQFVQPKVVVFLGDLFDEGSIASDFQFNSYARRLFNIFLDKQFSTTKHIWLPGDNDIGGEGTDLVTSLKLQRFNRAFEQPDVMEMRNVSFYKINRLTNSIPIINDNKDFFDVNSIRIGLSHMPLLFHPSLFVEQVLTKIQPHVLFTAHEHKSMIISTDGVARQDRQITPVTSNNNKVYTYNLGINNLYEIIVPTCSYRMGTNNIGYGYAIIENDELQYTILWSPDRLKQLVIYLIIAITFVLIIFFKLCHKIFCSKSKQSRINV